MSLGPDDVVLCAGTLGQTPLLERIPAAAGAGFDGISVFTTDVERALSEGCSVAELRSRIEDAGLAIAEVDPLASWYPGAAPGAGLLAASVDQALDMAEGLGARALSAIVFAPPSDEDALAAAFASLCDQASDRNLLVLLEFIPFSSVRCLADALAIVEAADRPNGGVMLDVWHLFRSGGTAAAVVKAADRILGVQLDDAPREPEQNLVEETLHRRLLPGQGDADVPSIVRALREGGSPAPLGVEVFSDELDALSPTEAARRAFQAVERVIARA
jgi:sugar phosphate isomerase/epimerase